MVRTIVQTSEFVKALKSLIKKGQLLEEDYNDFKNQLAKNPELGDLVVGTGGVRKARLKSASRGKSGGFRTIYYDFSKAGEIYMLYIYSKNEQENLSADEKNLLKKKVKAIQGK